MKLINAFCHHTKTPKRRLVPRMCLKIQHAMRMRHIILSSVLSLPLPYFSALPHKRDDFREKTLLKTKYVFWFSLLLFMRNISYSKKNSERRCHKYVFMWSTSYFCQTVKKPKFHYQIVEKHTKIKFHQNPSNGTPDLFLEDTETDGRTNTRGMTKLKFAVRNFATAPKNPR
jgi:hypothetical protein